MREAVFGMVTTYMLDLAGGLTQVLADGTHSYLYGNGRIAQYTGTDAQYFLPDGLGSVRQLAGSGGSISLARDYQPYGELLSTSGAGTTNYGFSGEWTSSLLEQDLIYLRARHYDPTVGRFTSADPSRQERNLYQYAASNPIMYTDPSGLLFWRFRSGVRANSMTKPSTYVRSNHPAHPWIEYWMEAENGFWNTQLEFPGGQLLSIDALVLHTGQSLSPPLAVGPVVGSIYEIEPADPKFIIKGWAEINTKWGMIAVGAPPFAHRGTLPMQDHWFQPRPIAPYSGAPYDWSGVRWQFGVRLSPIHSVGPVRVDPNAYGLSGIPNAYWIMLITNGLIIYVDEQTLVQSGVVISAVAVEEYLRGVYEKARQRPEGGGLPAPIPELTFGHLQRPGSQKAECVNPPWPSLDWLDDLLLPPIWQPSLWPMP